MPKAMRHMSASAGRKGVAWGEAAREAVSDEACDPPSGHQDAGLPN
jgi:hypothetical protein